MNRNFVESYEEEMIVKYDQPLNYEQQNFVCCLIEDLLNPMNKQYALLALSKIRHSVPDMGPLLWNTFGTMTMLLHEVISIYPKLSRLTNAESNLACCTLSLLQCVAEHPETRQLFLNANIHRFVYPFLDTVPHTKALEYLKLTSLGIIGSLVKSDEQEAIISLLSSEIIPSCLRNMEYGSVKSRTVATYILQRILLFDIGRNYICHTYERFSLVADILNTLVNFLLQVPSYHLLLLVIKCYLQLSENTRAREALRQSLPEALRDDTFMEYLKDDDRIYLDQLHENLNL